MDSLELHILESLLRGEKVIIPDFGHLKRETFGDRHTVMLYKSTGDIDSFVRIISNAGEQEKEVVNALYTTLSLPLKEGKTVHLPQIGIFRPKKRENGEVHVDFLLAPSLRTLLSNAEQEKLEQERLEKERLEKERLEQERLERERLEKERLEQERLEKERLEQERLEKERLEKECLERERLEQERLEKERLEKECLEKERLERERLEQERLEQERLEKERLEKECLEQERLERERLERERLEQERLERERLEREHLEQKRLEKERLEQERFEQERLEKERLEKKRLEKEQLDQKKLERERIKGEKIKQWRIQKIRLDREPKEPRKIIKKNRRKKIFPQKDNTDNLLSVRFQRILFFGFTYTIFCGIIRKWIFTGTISNVLLFGQLLLPLILAWQFLKLGHAGSKRYTSVIVLYCLILLLMAANPLNNTIFHGIFGFVIHAGFFCLIFAYLNIANLKINLQQLDNFLILLLVLETILASIQYNLPITHVLNKYGVENFQNTAAIGENVRATGTFGYLGGLQTMVGFYSFFAWSLANRRNVRLFFIVLVVTGYLSLLTGSRGAFFSFVILGAVTFYENNRMIRTFLKQIVGITLLTVLLFVFFNPFTQVAKVWNNFEQRTVSLNERGESSHRIYRQYLSAFLYHGEQPLFGAGLGSDYQGANAMFGTSITKQKYGYMEEEAERVVFEGGYTLYFIRLLLLAIALSAMRIKRLSKIILFILFMNSLIFNTYMIFFITMGFIWVNQTKPVKQKIT